jgi:hypothetical protein
VMVPGGISELSLADWDALVSVNLTGAFYAEVTASLAGDFGSDLGFYRVGRVAF